MRFKHHIDICEQHLKSSRLVEIFAYHHNFFGLYKFGFNGNIFI